jgi:DNA-directed RNA polymerase, mitochondrial
VAVNVVGNDQPQDVYAAVAEIVSKRIDDDACKTSLDGTKQSMAAKLTGKVNDRRIFKHTVMTSVYGVTPFTAKKLIESALRQLDLDLSPSDIPDAAQYLTQLTFESLCALFTSARDVQKWLAQMADEVVRSVAPEAALRFDASSKRSGSRLHGPYPRTLVSWTTPIGFQVTQAYRKHDSFTQQIRTGMIFVYCGYHFRME